jgi:short-subunit dehydrogenase
MKIAIITGASSGLGREFLFQANKWVNVDEIWVISRNEKSLEELKLITNIPLRIIPLDLTKEKSISKINELLEKESPDVKLLINNAGYAKFGDFDKIDLEDDLGMIDLNVKALVLLTRYVSKYMSSGAKILEVASRAAFQPIPYMATYQATKAFVKGYTESLYAESKPRGIRIMALCPSWVNTKFISRADTKQNDKVRYYGKIYEADVIVKRAYRDLYRRSKIVSTYGFNVKFVNFIMKFVSTKFVIGFYLRSQKKKQKIKE